MMETSRTSRRPPKSSRSPWEHDAALQLNPIQWYWFVCGLSCVFFFTCFKNSIDSSKKNYSFKEEVFSGLHLRLPAILKFHACFLPLRGQQSLFGYLPLSRHCAGATCWLLATAHRVI